MTEKLISDEELLKIEISATHPDFGFHNAVSSGQAINKLIARLRSAEEALRFYATLFDRNKNEPMLRREFGCGCCCGTNDAEGECDYDSNVRGLTAREHFERVKR